MVFVYGSIFYFLRKYASIFVAIFLIFVKCLRCITKTVLNTLEHITRATCDYSPEGFQVFQIFKCCLMNWKLHIIQISFHRDTESKEAVILNYNQH